ncbi:hypothetical protein [Streptomyces violaceusniger]|uniref:hypothetical protein n=1 Tax=Streptomyces violaceusniger TaxID=68280 RepID=UPI0037FF484B
MSRQKKVKPRPVPATVTAPVVGQLGFDTDEPWQPTAGCECWPPDVRGCGHCKACDTCQDCRRCAGAGCACQCEG